jgi:hypothetical protein
VPAQRLKKAKLMMKRALLHYRKVFKNGAITFKIHECIHLLDDLERFECHMDRISAYAFENFHKTYGDMINAGNMPVQQIK